VSELDALHLAPPLAEALLDAGWPADHAAVRDAAPVAARGHHLVLVAPPAPAWAAPLLAGVGTRLLGGRTGPVVALAPEESVDEWSRVAERVLGGTGLRLAGAHSPDRLTRLLRADALDLAFTSPATAHELVRHSALKMDAVAGVLLLWPEAWGDDDLLAPLLQDVPRETQRVIVTADAAGSSAAVERHAWRAPVVDLLGAPPAEPAPPVRSAPVAWRRRIEALADLAEQLDPESLAVWAADLGDRDAIAHALAAAGVPATIARETPPAASLIIAYDLPDPARLHELTGAGDVLLLVPPGAEAYVARLAPRRHPVHPRGLLDRAQADVAASRRRIAERLERGAGPAAWHAITPLLERHEAPAVAASLYELWDAARTAAPLPAPAAGAPGATARLWVGIGKRDAVTPHDLVGALVKECAVPREAIGKIEIRESFSLVELSASADPERVAERLGGKTIRKRRLAVRMDRKK
jgi:ATP-dependent RNA helicase DeaD